MIDTTEIFLAINSIRKNEKKKPSKSNIYQHLQTDEKHKELEYEQKQPPEERSKKRCS